MIEQLFFSFLEIISAKVKLQMASDNPTTQTHLEKEYQPQLEEIILRIKEIFTALGKINEKVDHIDKRLIVLEEQQKQVVGTKSLTTEINSASMKEINPVVPVKKTITENNQRSTCCICSVFGKTCTLYFDDLYDFDRKKINTEIGADALRFHCRCTHLIRDHARNPSSSLKIKFVIKNIFDSFRFIRNRASCICKSTAYATPL